MPADPAAAPKLGSGVSADSRSALASSEIGTEALPGSASKNSLPADPAADRLYGLLWNAMRDPSFPLWWCLDPKIKERFRAEVAKMRDPSERFSLDQLREPPTGEGATYD